MPQIGSKKREKIQEQILFYLYSIFPRPTFIANIACEIARDEEFIKRLILELLKKELVVKIDKNPQGHKYVQRARWRISNKAHDIYSKYQKKIPEKF